MLNHIRKNADFYFFMGIITLCGIMGVLLTLAKAHAYN